MSVVAAASAMGILVPPCLTMVVLGSLVNLSIVTLFLAGFVPAFMLAAALLVLIALRARRQNWPVTPARVARRISAARRAARRCRSACRSCSSAASSAAPPPSPRPRCSPSSMRSWPASLMGGIRRDEIAGQLAQSGIVTATTLWVLAAASAFAWILVREWVPQTLGEWIGGVGAGRVRLSWR